MQEPSELYFMLDAGHPCLPGHFPGRPIVPGVMLLDAALERIGGTARLDAVRFIAPVLPGERVRISVEPRAGGAVAFAGTVDGRPVFHGRARLR